MNTKLVLVTHYYATHGGGVEQVALEIARQLAGRHGYAVRWLASDLDKAPPQVGVDAVPMRALNVIERVTGIPYPIWSPRSIVQMAREIRAAEAIHLHDCLYMGNILAYLIARYRKKPVLVTQHIGLVPYRNPLLRLIHEMMNRILGKLILSGADQTIFYSPLVAEYFQSRTRFDRPPLLFLNGVDTSVFRPLEAGESRAQVRRNLGLAADRPVLLFVGRFVEKKGLHLLRRMAERTPEWTWLFAGRGPLDPGGWGLANVVVHHDRGGATLSPLYQAADVLVLPSVGEGFPLVVQESMACGTPALTNTETAAACPAAAEVLLHEPLDPAAAEATVDRWIVRLQSLLADPEALHEHGRKAAALAREIWSWDRCGQEYAQVLQRLVARDGAHAGER